MDPVGTHESDEKRMKGERQTPVNVVHEANSLGACRGRGSLVPRKSPGLLVLGAKKALTFEAAKCRRRARAFRPFRRASLARLILLSDGLTFSGGPLPHGCESGGKERRALVAMEFEGGVQTGSGRLKRKMRQEVFTEAITIAFIAGPGGSEPLIVWRQAI